MRSFFHAETQKYAKRRKYILWLTLLPLFQASLIAALIVIVNFRAFHEKGYHLIALRGITAAGAAGTLVFFAVFIITELLIKRNARYTFFEIAEKAIIFSRYDGDYISRGKRVVSRKLYIIPLSAPTKTGYSEKKRRIYIENEQIREYCDSSERLNYKLLDGFPEFESWWYNQNGFKILPAIKIPETFAGTDTEKLCRSIAEAKRNFDNAPKPKPHVHKEADFVRRRRAFEKLKSFQNY
ncbi:MAG: hypothetical protein LBC86_01775 [Oscillospiraceae bacterium]|jgi:hypothetical protein|nr:hypothetical protein [Oscillospiraceae bacterium]